MRFIRRPLALLCTLILGLTTIFYFPHRVLAIELPPPVLGTPEMAQSAGEAGIQFSGCSRVNVEPVNLEFEHRVVELANVERNSRGLAPLKRNTELDYAARYHSRDMLDDNYFSHDSQDIQNGSLVRVCGWSTRINSFYTGWGWLGENIAAGYSTPESVINGWMNSDGHRANILNPNYKEIGLGMYQGGGTYGTYWTQDFGNRDGNYPVVINLEFAKTDNPKVELYLYGAQTWNEMRIRNDNNEWSSWMPFQSRLTWDLNYVQGVRTVTVEYRRLGQTNAQASSSDTIELTSGAPQLGNIPASLHFVYVRSENRLIPEQVVITPQNVGGFTPIEWELASSQPWFVIRPASGTTPDNSANIQLEPNQFSLGEMTGTIIVSAQSGNPVLGSPATIPVTVSVVDDLPFTTFLPLLTR